MDDSTNRKLTLFEFPRLCDVRGDPDRARQRSMMHADITNASATASDLNK